MNSLNSSAKFISRIHSFQIRIVKLSAFNRPNKKDSTNWKFNKPKAKPLDFHVISTTTPYVYTTDIISEAYDISKYESEANRLFSLNNEYLSPKSLEYSLPNSGLPEFAFIGRSNVGKSSLISNLLNDKSMVRISKDPGCTKSVNYYGFITDTSYKSSMYLPPEERSKSHQYVLFLVDLPGYGYAKVSKASRDQWRTMIDGYICSRDQLVLRRTFLLIDSRHEIKQHDIDMMLRLNESNSPYQVILTKADLSTRDEKVKCLRSVFEQVFAKRQSCVLPYVHLVSSTTGEGIQELKNNITSIIKERYEENYEELLPILEESNTKDNNKPSININMHEINEFQLKVINAIKENALEEESYINENRLIRK